MGEKHYCIPFVEGNLLRILTVRETITAYPYMWNTFIVYPYRWRTFRSVLRIHTGELPLLLGERLSVFAGMLASRFCLSCSFSLGTPILNSFFLSIFCLTSWFDYGHERWLGERTGRLWGPMFLRDGKSLPFTLTKTVTLSLCCDLSA